MGPDTAGSFVRDSLLRVASLAKIPVDTLYRGERLTLGAMDLKVLWPPSFIAVGGNGASLVMQGRLSGEPQKYQAHSPRESSAGSDPRDASSPSSETSFLLTGDLDCAGEALLMELSADVSSNLLQVGHHGSLGSSSLEFLNRVSPQYAVVSVGRKNSYGHPAREVLRKLEYVLGEVDGTAQDMEPRNADGETVSSAQNSFDTLSRIYRTDRDGTVRFQLLSGVGVLKE